MKMSSDPQKRTIANKRNLKHTTSAGRASVKGRSIGRRLCAFLHSGDDGQAVVEIALMLPAVLVLLSGIFSAGLFLSNQQALTQAVGIGGNVLAADRMNSTNDPCLDVYTAITTAAPQLTPSRITLTVTMNGTAVTAKTCSGDGTADLVEGTSASVAATYPCPLAVIGVSVVPGLNCTAKVTEMVY